MKYFSYLNSAAEIIRLYKGQQPFHLFIKDFFRQYKKYGSSDRKTITQLCYCYFRAGRALGSVPIDQKILMSLFLCTSQHNAMLAALQPEWNQQVTASIEEKCTLINAPFNILQIFPCGNEVSDQLNTNDFISSHLLQPDVFLRIRPGYKKIVIDKLDQAQVTYSLPAGNCISLASTTKIADIVLINKEAVVQDYSSQRTGHFMELARVSDLTIKVWDCCAASGGKSIMAKDLLGKIDLTVSDIRASVVHNLRKRFSEAGIHHYKTLIADLSFTPPQGLPGTFQLVIADAPCTGSGTWGRTPERLHFFEAKEIEQYSQLQKKIVTTVMPAIESGGFFLYITCSVFTKENEAMADFIKTAFDVELVEAAMLKGYDCRADTMFAALFRKR